MRCHICDWVPDPEIHQTLRIAPRKQFEAHMEAHIKSGEITEEQTKCRVCTQPMKGEDLEFGEHEKCGVGGLALT